MDDFKLANSIIPARGGTSNLLRTTAWNTTIPAILNVILMLLNTQHHHSDHLDQTDYT